jgi:uncharacterized membrane protein YfcA
LVATAAAVVGFVLVVSAYLVAMRFSLDLSRVDEGRSADTRDLAYLLIHAAVFAGALLVGFLSERIGSGMGFAFVAIMAILTLAMMAGVQMGSFALACNGHNDLVRHWQC